MKKSLLCGVICLAAFANSVQAIEISKPSLNTLKQSTQPVKQESAAVKFDPSGTIGQINTQLYDIDSQVQAAYESLFSVLLSKEDYNKYKAELQVIKDNKNLSETEKCAKCAQVATDTSVILAKKEKQTEISGNIQKLDKEQRMEYVNAGVNLTIAANEYYVLAQECKSLSTRIASNPAQATSLAFELGQVKDMSKLLKANLTSVKNVTAQVIAINKANNIEVKLPDNKSGKTKKVNF